MKVIIRIVLSLIFGAVLAGFACCDQQSTNPGIGTSPSEPNDPNAQADDDPSAARSVICSACLPRPCGWWIDTDSQAADARALRGDPPDGIIFTNGHTTCVDAFHVAGYFWPGQMIVREVEQHWRAVAAGTCQ